MKKSTLLLLWLSSVSVIIALAFSASDQKDDPVARGKYLVEKVAMCGDCHTPRTETGEFDRTKWLRGGKLDFQPIREIPNWAKVAPPIAGLGNPGSGWTEERMTKLLETGLAPNGKPHRPPMPAYNMSREDAAAVAAYLKSLEWTRPK